jgi:stalled ribosome alternative rescue factor ArfA
MPAKTEKQKKFFGAVMGAKKGQKNVSGEAKKVAKELPKKEIKKFLKKEGEEDEESVSKQLKKSGKATIKGPKVKERKKFAPATKTESPKKGKGSYNRKETLNEDEESKSCWKGYKKKGMKKKGDKMVSNCVKESYEEANNISNFIDAVFFKNYSKANECLKKAVETKLAKKIQQEINTPLF